VGAKRYPEAREIFITADAGGSNSYRSHVWKHQLQRVADKLDMSIHVSHFPRRYPTGKKISKKELRELKVECEEFHGEWNYVIRSRMEQR
jgi:hypothetical protein